MRLLLAVFVVMTTFSSAEAQQHVRRPRLVLPEDTLFREPVVRRAIRFMQARKKFEHEANRLADAAGYKSENIGIHGSIADYSWGNEWCEFRKLSTREAHEMFDLRLVHYPSLRSYATKILGRNIAKKGFGWHIEGLMENDYNSEKNGPALGWKYFTQALGKQGFKPCVEYR